ncbi:MAG: non-ribosomal peptide synthetase, partial [bacterium]|nr:non-ribosomal peptide synthetase [bacterium]
IEFLGRIDHQVKIRGFRIELGEIENRLLSHPGIKEAVVLVKGIGYEEQYLCACIVPCGDGVEPVQLKEYLFETLPGYMIPGRFVTLEQMPATTSGKVDRRALAEYDDARLEIRSRYAAPGNAEEKLIAEVWQEVLSIEKVGIHDNFFQVGGTSFDIIKISTILNTRLGIKFPVVKMFKYPTIHTLA